VLQILGINGHRAWFPQKPLEFFIRFLIHVEIIKQGYGFAYTRFPFKYLEDFRRYQREARENRRGLWREK